MSSPRQKFCSVPGCLSTTELIRKEQTAFLASPCSKCGGGNNNNNNAKGSSKAAEDSASE